MTGWPFCEIDVPAYAPGASNGITSAIPYALPEKCSDGSGYAPADILTVIDGVFTTPATFEVISVGVRDAQIYAGGAGWAVGTEFYLDSPPGSFYVQATGRVTAVGAGGTVTAVEMMESGDYGSRQGSYTCIPYGPGGSGLVLHNIAWGFSQIQSVDPGDYSEFPASPADVSCSGSGTGGKISFAPARGSLRDALLNPKRIIERTTYSRAKGEGFDSFAPSASGPRHIRREIYNDPAEIGPYGYPVGDDSTIAQTASNFVITSTSERRNPPSNPQKVLDQIRIDVNRDVGGIVGGSVLAGYGVGFRSSSASFVDTYATMVSSVVMDPSSVAPKGALWIGTAEPANVAGGVGYRLFVGWGIWTSNKDGNLNLPGADMGRGTINAAEFYVSGKKVAEKSGDVAASRMGRAQKNVTSNYSVTVDDCNKSILNGNAGAKVICTLPDVSTCRGMVIRFYNLTNHGLQINAASGDAIRIGGGYYPSYVQTSGIGSVIELEALYDATTWIATGAPIGAWSL